LEEKNEMLSESTTGSAVVSLLPRSLIYGDIYMLKKCINFIRVEKRLL
jgi:hypothetical protein